MRAKYLYLWTTGFV